MIGQCFGGCSAVMRLWNESGTQDLRIAAKQEQTVLVCGHRHVAHRGRGLLGNRDVRFSEKSKPKVWDWWAISDQRSAISLKLKAGWGNCEARAARLFS